MDDDSDDGLEVDPEMVDDTDYTSMPNLFGSDSKSGWDKEVLEWDGTISHHYDDSTILPPASHPAISTHPRFLIGDDARMGCNPFPNPGGKIMDGGPGSFRKGTTTITTAHSNRFVRPDSDYDDRNPDTDDGNDNNITTDSGCKRTKAQRAARKLADYNQWTRSRPSLSKTQKRNQRKRAAKLSNTTTAPMANDDRAQGDHSDLFAARLPESIESEDFWDARSQADSEPDVTCLACGKDVPIFLDDDYDCM